MTPLILFTAACSALLILPFLPAILEWRRPSDRSPLQVSVAYPADASQLANEFREEIRGSMADAARSLVPAGTRHGCAGSVNAAAPVLIHKPLKSGGRLAGQEVVYAASDFEAAANSSFSAVMCEGNLDVGSGSEISGWAHADRNLRLGDRSIGLRRLSAGQEIRLERDCCFERIHAAQINFGAACSDEPHAAPAERTPLEWSALAGARRASEVLFQFAGDCDVPDASHMVGSIVVCGVLSIGAGALIEGDIKAHKGVLIAAGAQVLGSVVCDGSIHMRPFSQVDGPIVSEGSVQLARGCKVGHPTQPTTITAPVILIETGAVAHGTVWARRGGVVWGMD